MVDRGEEENKVEKNTQNKEKMAKMVYEFDQSERY
jgi:hypothetical protein